jgi:uncharacterized protein
MLVPTGGFGWVIGDHEVARRSHSECVINVSTGTEAGVEELVNRAHDAGAEIVTEPGQQPWDYAGAFADPDDHIWIVARLSVRGTVPAHPAAAQTSSSLPDPQGVP